MGKTFFKGFPRIPFSKPLYTRAQILMSLRSLKNDSAVVSLIAFSMR